MVQHQQQDVTVEPGPDRDLPLQVERVQCRALPRAHHKLRRGLVEHELVRTVRTLREDRAQRLVPRGHVGERGAQRLDVGLGQPDRARDVVGGGTAFEPVQEPQALLRERQRHALRPGHRRDGGPDATFPHLRRETRHGGRLEQVTDLELGAEHGPDAVHDPGGEQRVATEIEEAVVDPRRHPEHLGEQAAKDLLDRGAWRPAFDIAVRRFR
ncbi:hypothetical protein Lesp02_07090 [Lentzea sp. NBRC 105346]|nr:hypothetical protein Lesp02_07090 [Lentzea sp. NBRC 105346]